MPVRVAHVLACDGFGGTEMQVAALLEGLDRSQVSSLVLTLAPAGPVAARLRWNGIEVHSLGGGGPVRTFVRLALALRRARPQVVNAYGFTASLATRMLVALLLRRSAFVCGVRGQTITETEQTDDLKARIALGLERLTTRLVDAYDANSPGALELLAGAGIDSSRLHYIPNGLDLDRWPERPCRSAGEQPQVVCVARLVPRKHVLDLVTAASILSQRGFSISCVLAGDGPCREQIVHTVRRSGLDDQVQLVGTLSQERVAALLAEADIFCLPSMWEGMAVSVMEAMASGLPVVGTDVNGIRELVDHGSTGLLVRPGDAAALADALAMLLTDEACRREMGSRGRARIEREFSMDRLTAAKTALYHQVASGS